MDSDTARVSESLLRSHPFCFVCGLPILPAATYRQFLKGRVEPPLDELEWLGQFRVVRVLTSLDETDPYDINPAFVSGLTLASEATCHGPLQYRSTDPSINTVEAARNFNFRDEHRFRGQLKYIERTSLAPYLPVADPLEDSAPGFHVHDSCWWYLNNLSRTSEASHFADTEEFVQMVFDLCQNLTFTGPASDWAAGYDGLRYIRSANLTGKDLSFTYFNPRSAIEPHPVSEDAPGSPTILAATEVQQDGPKSISHIELLPGELVMEILTFLPTQDAMAFLTATGRRRKDLPQTFYKSRFAQGMELASIIESAQWLKDRTLSVDWEATYATLIDSTEVRCRNRLYRLAQRILAHVSAIGASGWPRPAGYVDRSPRQRLAQNQMYKSPVMMVCSSNRALYRCSLSLENTVIKYRLYYATIGDQKYLAGMELNPGSSSVGMGYASDKLHSQIIYCTSTPGHTQIILDRIGIRDLRFVGINDKADSVWTEKDFKCHPKAEHSLDKPAVSTISDLALQDLTADFSATHMVSIGLTQHHKSFVFPGERQQAINDVALSWQPALPPPWVLKNLVRSRDVYTNPVVGRIFGSYNPYNWVLFDDVDSDECKSKYLVKIHFHISDETSLEGLEFFYEVPGVEGADQSTFSTLHGRRNKTPARDGDAVVEMPIDGLGGETISGVTIFSKTPNKNMFLFHTNREVWALAAKQTTFNTGGTIRDLKEDILQEKTGFLETMRLRPQIGYRICGFATGHGGDGGVLLTRFYNFGILQESIDALDAKRKEPFVFKFDEDGGKSDAEEETDEPKQPECPVS